MNHFSPFKEKVCSVRVIVAVKCQSDSGGDNTKCKLDILLILIISAWRAETRPLNARMTNVVTISRSMRNHKERKETITLAASHNRRLVK